jgi:hypothetical protein
MIEQCDGCKFFLTIDAPARRFLTERGVHDVAVGYCRRNPPTPEHSGETLSVSVKVAVDWWCGEFKAKDDK